MPPAYEVLLLNTAIPQIQAAQSGDTYVVPRDIAINATAIISANSATDALRITQTGAGNAILVEDSANPDSTPFVVTATGAVGVGTTSPSTIFHAANENPILLIQETDQAANSQRWGIQSETSLLKIRAFNDAMSSAVDLLIGDRSGNLGLGVTPSAWNTAGSAYRVFQLSIGAALHGRTGNYTQAGLSTNAFVNSSGAWTYMASTFAALYAQDAASHSWYTAPTGTAGAAISFTQAMTLDASGNLAVGTTSPISFSNQTSVTVNGTNTGRFDIRQNGTHTAALVAASTYVDLTAITNVPLTFGTNSAERARITSGGYFKASDNGTYASSTGTYHEFNQTANERGLQVRTTNASYTNKTLEIASDRNTTDNSYYFIGASVTAVAYRFQVADSGTVTNATGTYGTISDAKMKTDIVDAGSQWSDIKALRFRKFKIKDDPSGRVQLGVVAQELEQTSPGLVEEHTDRDAEGNDLGTTTKSVKTSVLLMKAAVALQEAMARIEKLESEVAALKGA